MMLRILDVLLGAAWLAIIVWTSVLGFRILAEAAPLVAESLVPVIFILGLALFLAGRRYLHRLVIDGIRKSSNNTAILTDAFIDVVAHSARRQSSGTTILWGASRATSAASSLVAEEITAVLRREASFEFFDHADRIAVKSRLAHETYIMSGVH